MGALPADANARPAEFGRSPPPTFRPRFAGGRCSVAKPFTGPNRAVQGRSDGAACQNVGQMTAMAGAPQLNNGDQAGSEAPYWVFSRRSARPKMSTV